MSNATAVSNAAVSNTASTPATSAAPARYDIIIPHYGIVNADVNTNVVAVTCLETIYDYSADYRVIFIDNGGDREDWPYIAAMLAAMPHLLIRNTENIGFVRSVNQGLMLSTAPYVVLLNNDAEAAPGWLDMLRTPLEEIPRCGISGPRSTDGGWQARTPIRHTAVLPPGHMLAFFCAMFSRQCLTEVGLQDEAFVPYAGFGGDDHYCAMAQRKNWSLALVGELVIPHRRRTTMRAVYGDERIAEMQRDALAKVKEMVREGR